ncbi:transposable element Tcb2 transposase [Trichonephila clavipes]|nr:transposable element Tcb2 transposase [Trichonephila clavipes]
MDKRISAPRNNCGIVTKIGMKRAESFTKKENEEDMPLRRFRIRCEQLSQFERGRIIGMMEAGCESKICHLHEDYGQDRPQPSTDQSSRRLPHHKKCTRTTALSAAIQAQVALSLGIRVSSRTIRRRLAEGHLVSRRPLRVLLLKQTHQTLCLKWCRARGNWIVVEWKQVVFSDESRFNLSSDGNRVRVRRPHGERSNSAFALQRHTTPTTGVLVWGAIAYNTRSPPVLSPVLHTARVSQDCLLTVTTFPCPVRFPDFSPIEHIWEHLGRRFGNFKTLNELEARL